MPISETDIAWAAGLFEGEGYLCTHTVNRRGHLTAGIEMRDRDIIERFSTIMVAAGTQTKAGIKTRWRGNENHSRLYSWNVSGSAAEHIYQTLRPYLGERRRKQADTILAHRLETVAAQTVSRSCLGCGSTFTTTPHSFARKVWCSRKCYDKAKNETEHFKQLARARSRRYKQRQRALRAGAMPGTSPHSIR